MACVSVEPAQAFLTGSRSLRFGSIIFIAINAGLLSAIISCFLMLISSASRIYPPNKFGRHNNVHFYHYQSYALQGNNYHNYGLHIVEVRNNMSNKNIEVVGWHITQGRLEEDFSKNVIRPCLFNTARIVPMSWTKYNAIVGAVVLKIQGTNQFFTVAFEDPFHDYVGKGYKGYIMQGNDPETAIKNLQDNTPKEKPWGRYFFDEHNGRGRSVIEFRDPQ